MNITFLRFIGDGDKKVEKSYEFNDLGFMPRKGDLVEDEAFITGAVVKDVQIYLDLNDCVIYLDKHDLSQYPQSSHEEILEGYYQNGWTNG